jgi:zinc transporter, ZIP family
VIEPLVAAAMAGSAIVLGTVIPRWRRPTTLASSTILGFAAGAMIGTVTFEILPEALALASLSVVAAGFGAGFAVVYGLDLGIHHGRVAGERADQWRAVAARYEVHQPLGGAMTVLAGAALFEAAIEGLSLGVGSAIGASLTLPLAIAVAIDNFSEGLSLGTLAQNGTGRESSARAVWWSVVIWLTTIAGALIGWLALRDLPPAVHAAVFAAGGGGMLYLTIVELVPEAEAEQYQQSAALACAFGFLLLLVLSEVH